MSKHFWKFLAAAGAASMLIGVIMTGNPAEAGISGSSHDLSGLDGASARICAVCHTPHNSDTTVADAPLWNHTLTTTTHTDYGPTANAQTGNTTGISRLCLSCHDGSVNTDAYGGGANATMTVTGTALVGVDLSNDHPVGVSIPGADPEYQSAVGNTTLYGALSDTVECASCHEVHNNGAGATFMLRTDNAGSALCLECHIK